MQLPSCCHCWELQVTVLHCQWLLAVVASPASFTGLLPAGSLYSTFATCYMKLAGDDMDLGPSFQQHLDKAHQEQHHAALKQPTAAEVSAMPKLHLNHPDIRDNGLYQVKQQAPGGVCC